jgi:hypothetical protein
MSKRSRRSVPEHQYHPSYESREPRLYIRKCRRCGEWFNQYSAQYVSGAEGLNEINLSWFCKECDNFEGLPENFGDSEIVMKPVHKVLKELRRRKNRSPKPQSVYQ